MGVRTLAWLTIWVVAAANALALLAILIIGSVGTAAAVLAAASLAAGCLSLLQLQRSSASVSAAAPREPAPAADSGTNLPVSDVTGLNLMWVFRQRLEDEVARDNRYGHYFTMLLLEPADVLALPSPEDYAEAGKELRHTLRAGDFAAQYDAERFIVLMPETDGSSAKVAGKRILSRLREVTPSQASWRGSVVRYPEDGENAEELLHKAAELLKQGRVERAEREAAERAAEDDAA